MSDDIVPILLSTAFEGTREVGSTYSHIAPGSITNNGSWSRVGGDTKSITVINGTNEVTFVYTRVLSADEVTIRFVDADLMPTYPANILTTSNAGYKQVGSVYTYTPPSTYIDSAGRGWHLVSSSPVNYTVLSNNNYIVVQYKLVSRPLSNDEVIVKYVEYNNTSNVLKTINEGQIEIDTVYSYTPDVSFTNSSGTWNLYGGSGARTHTVVPNGNTIYVYYTRTQASTYVKVTYVDKDDPLNILHEETGSTLLYIGQTYPYTVPGSFPDSSGGLWSPVTVSSGNYNHTVTASNNHIIIECEKLMADVTINYVDYADGVTVIYTDTISAQIGTSFTYEYAPEDYVDVVTGEHWALVPSQHLSIVVDADAQENIIDVMYLLQEYTGITRVEVTGDWSYVSSSGEVIVVLTNIVTGKRYHGLLQQDGGNMVIFKDLPLGNYYISCMDQLNMQYTGSDVEDNVFLLSEDNDNIKIEVINKRVYPNGFHSIDAANNPMKIYISPI